MSVLIVLLAAWVLFVPIAYLGLIWICSIVPRRTGDRADRSGTGTVLHLRAPAPERRAADQSPRRLST